MQQTHLIQSQDCPCPHICDLQVKSGMDPRGFLDVCKSFLSNVCFVWRVHCPIFIWPTCARSGFTYWKPGSGSSRFSRCPHWLPGKFVHLDLGGSGPQHTICGGTNLDTPKPKEAFWDTVSVICRAGVSEEKCPWLAGWLHGQLKCWYKFQIWQKCYSSRHGDLQ